MYNIDVQSPVITVQYTIQAYMAPYFLLLLSLYCLGPQAALAGVLQHALSLLGGHLIRSQLIIRDVYEIINCWLLCLFNKKGMESH